MLIKGDCLVEMDKIPDGSVDLILTDPPYGSTACVWDSVIPFEPMWRQLNRIIKANGAIALFGSEPFSSYLRISNIKNYKYDWIWNKKIPSGMCNAKIMPMRQHELVSVFIDGKNYYFPQKTIRDKPIKKGGNKESISAGTKGISGEFKKTYYDKMPTSILVYDKVRRGSLHPTQKPVALMEYLIKTYTNENETVLDFTMGSGTTGVACVNTHRKFIGIEMDAKYFEIAKKRINDAQIQTKLSFI
jgi:DNA modification methylase